MNWSMLNSMRGAETGQIQNLDGGLCWLQDFAASHHSDFDDIPSNSILIGRKPLGVSGIFLQLKQCVCV